MADTDKKNDNLDLFKGRIDKNKTRSSSNAV